MRCEITLLHCENCGSTDYEDTVVDASDGYTGCCNELLSYGPTDCQGHHLEG